MLSGGDERRTATSIGGEPTKPSKAPLVSVAHAPHIPTMTTIETPESDARHQAAIIARWDNEGGAAMSLADEPDAQASGNERSKRIPGVPAFQEVDPAFDDDEWILRCLGAAVIMRWSTLPTKIQRELFEHATSLADLTQTAQRKGQIARFLHDHKDEGAPTPRQGMA